MARTHVIVADDVLKRIDAAVGQRGRSRFIEAAAREKLERLDMERAVRKSAGVLDVRDYPDWRDVKSAAAWVRHGRRDRRS